MQQKTYNRSLKDIFKPAPWFAVDLRGSCQKKFNNIFIALIKYIQLNIVKFRGFLYLHM